MNANINKSQRATATAKARAAEIAVYELMAYLDDLGADEMRGQVATSLQGLRRVTKAVANAPATDDPTRAE